MNILIECIWYVLVELAHRHKHTRATTVQRTAVWGGYLCRLMHKKSFFKNKVKQ